MPDPDPFPASSFRLEHDLIGDKQVPAAAYWGIHTLRAIENFPITGTRIGSRPELVKALAYVKQACARANLDLGQLAPEKAQAIEQACRDIIDGALHDQFIVDVIQGGAGTSTNMNANEVVANRALELMGKHKGDYKTLHPIEDVNASQSTNDVYPTALRVAICFALDGMTAALAHLRHAFETKATEFNGILKMGRTQLQDAVPMTLGQEFRTYALMLHEDESQIAYAAKAMRQVNLGGTAIGTGINTDPDYSEKAVRHLAEITGLDLTPAPDLITATQDTSDFVLLSGILKRFASKLSKICNDLRLLSSGPQSGLGEIFLPERAAGSSIMPGKVNPIIPEVVNQIAFEVIGNDVTITMASEAGQLQLNAFEPIIGWSLFKSISHLEAGCLTLADNCVSGITANRERLEAAVSSSAGLATALNPVLGYQIATEIARAALKTGTSVRELVKEKGLMNDDALASVLSPDVLTRPYRFN
ncbi:aspartate ammonia-lyase [Neopusillimonas aromaticivorans]|uniref:aspartate ammonia-lyase n=1 Tax=Neopusillimonas aromaticivorans TaxID=2979868 RepID=UPI002599A57D|nr:aspartate ammonia-lyase [Neopusillimonas aromaticivorans]NLZ12032.1 aspartate ammonia-lyase [Alcaligenaceae bacterium]WJJ94609.1 aspartate ammonia-lyase [Neopusillimonas aromaticivorans]